MEQRLRLVPWRDVTLFEILVVFLAGIFHDLPVRSKVPGSHAIPGFGVSLRIVDRDRVGYVAQIRASEAFDRMQLVAMRMADRVDAGKSVKRDGVDNQRVALPVTD